VSAVQSSQIAALKGRFLSPGDKSISHRALMLSALCVGESQIFGLLEGDDVLATASAMRAMGASVEKAGGGANDGKWTVHGVGVGGLSQPKSDIDMGNSGTAVRLLMGLVASHALNVTFTGDASLCSRPMGRVLTPLKATGAQFSAAEGDRLPLTIEGAAAPLPTRYEVPVPSAQVKSAVLLAGLNTAGTTTVFEREATRDHTENMLRAMGADISVSATDDGGREISLCGPAELQAQDIIVPGDPSSAAFLVVAALITPGSAMTVENVGMNALRTGLFVTLLEMGADLRYVNERVEGGEPVADIDVRYSALKGVTVPAERAPSMIDEYPVLAVAAAAASGPTMMPGLAELRVKETDRLKAIADGLIANKIEVQQGEDWLQIEGTAGHVPGGGMVATHMDHRIAMSFLILGCVAEAPVTIDEDAMIATSFPSFMAMMREAGASFEAVPS
jgi:3-phosphoshikimate 1-carboxyvinyltransferase